MLAIRSLAVVLMGTVLVAQVHAQTLAQRNGFPSQPIRFVSPFPPGGGNDATTRWVTTRLPELTGQPAVVENKGERAAI